MKRNFSPVQALARCLILSLAFAATTTVSLRLAAEEVPAPQPATAPVYRFDPLANRIVPIAPSDLRAGNVYDVVSPRLNRRVWSLLQADGTFGFALGEGSTLPPRDFDLRASQEDILKKARTIPGLVEEYARTGRGEVALRLTASGTWVLDRTQWPGVLYDGESGRRWQRSGATLTPIVHADGDRWEYRNGKFVPAGSSWHFGTGSFPQMFQDGGEVVATISPGMTFSQGPNAMSLPAGSSLKPAAAGKKWVLGRCGSYYLVDDVATKSWSP